MHKQTTQNNNAPEKTMHRKAGDKNTMRRGENKQNALERKQT